MPAELTSIPFFADVETVWMPAELVLMPFFANVETVWMLAELVLMDNSSFAMLLAFVLNEAVVVASKLRIFYATDRLKKTYSIPRLVSRDISLAFVAIFIEFSAIAVEN